MATIEPVHSRDEVLHAVRATKERLAAAFDFDIHRIIQDARRRQSSDGRQVLPQPERKVLVQRNQRGVA
jgi:hypothetical protein